MSRLSNILIDRAIPSSDAQHERLSVPIGLAILSSDVISSAAYATDELLAVLVLGGALALGWSIPLAAIIVGLLAVLVISYRQVIRAYPSGGGAYTVAKENLGQSAGLIAASGLLIDYILTVSVSIAAGIDAMTSAFPVLAPARVELGLVCLLILIIGNLRGVKEAGRMFSLPTMFFVGAIAMLMVVGLVKHAMGQSAGAVQSAPGDLTSSLSLFLLLRAFSSGCTALTGTEAISNGVRIFKKPEAENARKTMLFMGIILGVLFLGITYLARIYGVLPSANQTVISQIAHLVFGTGPLYYVVQFSTLLILLMAANTSFSDFPRVASMLGRDRYLPNQLSDIGSRLVYSNGIVLLGVLSGLLLVIFEGSVASLIPMYAVGVFISFTLSQTGMVRHWYRLKEKHWFRSSVVNGIGAVLTAAALIVIAATKFTHGAWLILLLVPLFLLLFSRIHGHYEELAQDMSLHGTIGSLSTMTKRHTVVMLVSGVHKGVMHALDYARVISGGDIQSVYVDCEGPDKADDMRKQWAKYLPDIPLIVLPSPRRDIVEPVVNYLRTLRAGNNNLVTVMIPEFVNGGWWTQLLHRRMAAKLKAALLYQCYCPVVSVPSRRTRPVHITSTNPVIDKHPLK